MKPIEQYQRFGLAQPITIRPGVRYHLLLWGGGGFLMLGCVLALTQRAGFEQAMGALGLLFFGLALGIMIFALVKSRSRGLCELSEHGLYMAHLGVILPWKDIGPAWCAVYEHQGGRTKDVCFVLRNITQHIAGTRRIGRFLLRLSQRVAQSKSEGILVWGLRIFMKHADVSELYDQLAVELGLMREAIQNQPDSSVFNIPVPLRFGISAEELVAILNREFAVRRGLLGVARHPSAGRGCQTSIRWPGLPDIHPTAGLPDIRLPASSKRQGNQMREATNTEKRSPRKMCGLLGDWPIRPARPL
jgi:hypothetical protein